MRHLHRVEPPVEALLPEIQEFAQLRKFGLQIVVLPDVGLHDRRMIGQTVENIGRRQP